MVQAFEYAGWQARWGLKLDLLRSNVQKALGLRANAWVVSFVVMRFPLLLLLKVTQTIFELSRKD